MTCIDLRMNKIGLLIVQVIVHHHHNQAMTTLRASAKKLNIRISLGQYLANVLHVLQLP